MSPFWSNYYKELIDALIFNSCCTSVETGVLSFNDTAESIATWLYCTDISLQPTRELRTCISNLAIAADSLAQLNVLRPFSAYLAGSPHLVTAVTDQSVPQHIWCETDVSSNTITENTCQNTTIKTDEDCSDVESTTPEVDRLIVGGERGVYSDVSQALLSHEHTEKELLKLLVPDVQRHIVLMWGVMEQLIERIVRPFKMAPIMPTGCTEYAVIEELVMGAYSRYSASLSTESSSNRALEWIIDSLTMGQRNVLFVNSVRHNDKYYTLSLSRCGVFVLPAGQPKHPICGEEPRVAATLINLMLGEPLGLPVDEWAISHNVTATYMGEKVMRAAISAPSVIHECVEYLSTKYDLLLVNNRVREVLCIVSGTPLTTPGILKEISCSTFSEDAALDHAISVRHVCSSTYVYSGTEEYIVEHSGRRLELGPSHDGETIQLRWTNLVEIPPQCNFYADERIIAAIINNSNNTVSHKMVKALAREGAIGESEVYFNVVMFASRKLNNRLLLTLIEQLDISATHPASPCCDYHTAVKDGDNISLELLQKITSMHILHGIVGIQSHRKDGSKLLNVGRRIYALMPVLDSRGEENGMVIYNESDATFELVPRTANETPSYITNIMCLLNEKLQTELKYIFSPHSCKISTLLHLVELFLARTQPPDIEVADLFFIGVLAAYESQVVSDGSEHIVTPVIDKMVGGARTCPDIHSFVYNQLFTADVWNHTVLKRSSINQSYTELLVSHFELTRMPQPKELWSPPTDKSVPPIAVANANLFITLEFNERFSIRVRSRETLQVVTDKDHLVRMLMNDDPNIADYKKNITTICREPFATALLSLPPVVSIPCLHYASSIAHSDQPQAHKALILFALEYFERFCDMYNISFDERPVIFKHQRPSLSVFPQLIERAFFDRLEPYAYTSIVTHRMRDELYNTTTISAFNIMGRKNSHSQDLRWLDTPTCSFLFDDVGPVVGLLNQSRTSNFWYWSVLAMFDIVLNYQIGFLETRAKVKGSDDASVLVLFISNSGGNFPPMGANAQDSIRYLSERYPTANPTAIPNDIFLKEDCEEFLPVLLRQWIETPDSMTDMSRQRCVIWLSLARSLFAPTGKERSTPVPTRSVKKAGTHGIFEAHDLIEMGDLKLDGDGYGLLVVPEYEYYRIISMMYPMS